MKKWKIGKLPKRLLRQLRRLKNEIKKELKVQTSGFASCTKRVFRVLRWISKNSVNVGWHDFFASIKSLCSLISRNKFFFSSSSMDFEEFDDVVWRDFFLLLRSYDSCASFNFKTFDDSFMRNYLTTIFVFEFFKGFPRILRRSEARFFCFFGRATRAQVSTSKPRKRRDFPMDLDPSFIRIHLTTIFFRILQRISKYSST